MRLDEAVAYVIDVEFVWGYQATIAGLTKSPPPYTYPPPTTFLGALTEAIARSEGLGEDSFVRILNELVKNLVAIALKPLNCVPVKYQDISKIIAIKTSSGIKYPSSVNIYGSFDAPARGKTILSSLNGDPPRIRWVLVWREGRTNPYINEKYFWRIHRVGGKESVASVTNVSKKYVTEVGNEEFMYTTYSFPLKAVSSYKPKSGAWIVEPYVNPFSPFSDNETPAFRYLKGDIMHFVMPVRSGMLDEPLSWARTSKYGVFLRVEGEDGVVVGVRK